MGSILHSVQPSIAVAGHDYRVLAFALRERMSEVSSLVCSVVHDDHAAPNPAALVGKHAHFVLERSEGGPKRTFAGTVVEATRLTRKDDVKEVELVVWPGLQRLAKRADCRIFQKLSVPDIVKKVLVSAGVPAAETEWKLSGSYAPRDYVAQYRETDLDFATRLLSEEGIYYAVHFDDDKEHVVFSDDPSGIGDVAGPTTLPFRHTFGDHEADDSVRDVVQQKGVRSDKVSLRDYNPLKPKLKLDAAAEGTDDGEHALEVYDYPGRYADKGVGERLAKVRVQALQADRDVVRGHTGTLTLRPGLRFAIEDHPYAPLNQKYLVVGLVTEGSESRAFEQASAHFRYQCSFEAVPAKTTKYSPPFVAREKIIPGLQTAITTGPPGEEIHTDAHGRVKVQYHWDRLGKKDDGSSLWMRTSQLATGGSVLLPRMTWEVSVCHLEGDADRPLVMGRLYNGTSRPPYALPDHKARTALQTNTSPGGGSSNELRMDDSKGSEEMFMNASKDMSVDVKNNATESIGNNLVRAVGSNHSLSVTNSVSANVGADQKIDVGANQTLNVETYKVDDVGGAHTLKIGGNRTMMIGGDHKKDVGGSSAANVDGVQIDLVVGSSAEHALGNMKHNVGAALVELTAADRSVMVGGSRAEITGAVKIIGTMASRGVEVRGSVLHKVAGAILESVKQDRVDQAGANLTEIAAGAHIVKANAVAFEAETMLSLVMGASTITLLPAMVVIGGVSLKLDGEVADEGALIVDN